MKPLILASRSPYRKQLLEQFHLPFSVVSADIDESPLDCKETPADLALRLADEKARAVLAKHPQALVIGADQVATIDNSVIIGKPGDFETAFKQLQLLSGKTITFYSALCLIGGENQPSQSAVIPTHVTFYVLSNAQIQTYLEKEPAFDCCGSFKCEGLGISLIREIDQPDPTALIGLPLITLASMLAKAGMPVL